MPSKKEMLEYGQKMLTSKGLEHLQQCVRKWSDDPENLGWQGHCSLGQWIHNFFVQDHFSHKYDFDLSQVTWEDIADLPFTEQVKSEMLHMKDCEKCLKTLKIQDEQLQKHLVYRSVENYLYYNSIPCKN
jgi:hypothetical protein